MAVSLEVQLSQLRAASPQDSSCTTNDSERLYEYNTFVTAPLASAYLELLDRCHGRKDDLRGSFVAFTFLAKVFCQMNECIPEVAKATRACVKGQVHANLSC
jgi:hypothetical protein